MLHSGREHTPVLVVSTTSETAAVHSPVAVADQLELCKLANHPWQVCCDIVKQLMCLMMIVFWNR